MRWIKQRECVMNENTADKIQLWSIKAFFDKIVYDKFLLNINSG